MRLLNLFRRARLDREMHDEIAFHIQSRADDLERTGLTRAEAERRARVEFGGLEKYKEQVRDTRRVLIVDDLLRDLGYAWRSLRRTPVFTLTAAGAIALGVAVNTGFFSLIYAAFLRPMPVKDPGTVRNVYVQTIGEGRRSNVYTNYAVSFAEFSYMRRHARTTALAGLFEEELSCACSPSGQLKAQLVSDNLLPLIGATPAAGRFFAPGEATTAGRDPVAVLSFHTWKQMFGGAPDAIGRTVLMNRTPFTIIGVADERTTGPLLERPDVWIPLTVQGLTGSGEPMIDNPSVAWIRILARRHRDATDAAMRAELAVLGQQALVPHNAKRRAVVTVAPAAFLNFPDLSGGPIEGMATLFVAGSLVLLIACANVANLMLARGLTRRREIAIRISLGAGRRRILQQILTESALLGLLGGAIGLAVAQIPGRLVLAARPPAEWPAHQLNLSPDWTVVAYVVLLSLAASLIFGGIPALRHLRVDLTPALKGTGMAWSAGRRIPLQGVLVAVQAAVSLVLLANAGLLFRALDRATHMDLGLASQNVLIASFNFRQERYSPQRAERFLTDLRDDASRWPSVSGATLSGMEQLVSSCSTTVRVIDADGSPGEPLRASCDYVGVDFFTTMGVRLLQGRGFTADDLRRASNVVIVDESFARLSGAPALGSYLQIGASNAERSEIVGVATSTRRLVPGDEPWRSRKIYYPLKGNGYLAARLLLHVRGSPEALAREVRAAVATLDPGLHVAVKSIEENKRAGLFPVRIASAAAAMLGGMGLLLACTGLYGVVAFTVGSRRREIGIRLALGAERRPLMRWILGHGMRPVLAGGAAGLILAVGAATLLRSMLFGVSPLDPVALGGTAAALLLSATIAAFIPARAALRIDPAITLREE